jgi:hypothetical protein
MLCSSIFIGFSACDIFSDCQMNIICATCDNLFSADVPHILEAVQKCVGGTQTKFACIVIAVLFSLFLRQTFYFF